MKKMTSIYIQVMTDNDIHIKLAQEMTSTNRLLPTMIST